MADMIFFIGDRGPYVYDDSNSYVGGTPFIYTAGAGKIAFVASDPATITDADSGFVSEGFVAGDIIRILGAGANNGLYQVATVVAGTLTLHTIHSLSANTPAGVVTIEVPAISAVMGTDVLITAIKASALTDADGDTQIQVEESADEDKIRGDVGGSEVLLLSGTATETYVKLNKVSDADGDTFVQVEESADEDKVRIDTGGTQRALVDSDGLTLQNGVSVNEFSIDTNLAGDSDDAVPTEKAVKTYVDTATGGASVDRPSLQYALMLSGGN